EKADTSRLEATGWQPPIPITVKARDGSTYLYGLMFKPPNFDSTKKYPVVDWIYPGPWIGSVTSWGFAPANFNMNWPAPTDNNINMKTLVQPQEFAALGFIVVAINGMGTAGRSQAFRDVSYRNYGDATLPDQVAGIRELAHRYPWIDLDRVGIAGH